MGPSSIEQEQRGAIRYVWLNRPERRNAFDLPCLQALQGALSAAANDAGVRVLVLAARGEVFCAGGDLQWMQRGAGMAAAENQSDAETLARVLYALYSFPKPLLARIQGDCYGGGVGLIAACDIAIASAASRFSLPEVRLGLIPATIAPYVIRAIGARQASRYMLTGERFGSAEALSLGLVHEVCDAQALDTDVERCTAQLLLGGPEALKHTKALIDAHPGSRFGEYVIADTAARLAEVRASAEAAEGIGAFLARRKPAWSQD